jgi:hypothetical protein
MAIVGNTGIGYRGFLILNTGTDKILLPCTGPGPDITPTLITPDNIHGSVDANDAQQAHRIHYAEGQVTYDGDIEFPFYEDSTVWGVVKDWIYANRTTPMPIVYFSPDGALVHKYSNVYVATAEISNRGANNLITARLRIVAEHRTVPESGELSGITLDLLSTEATQNKVPVPFWRSMMELENIYTDTTGLAPTAWTVRINHNTVTVFVANGSNEPFAIKQGLVVVDGSITLYKDGGVPLPNSRKGKVVIKVGGTLPDSPFATFTMNNVALVRYSYPMRAPSEVTTRDLEYQAFAGKYNAAQPDDYKLPALQIS